MDTGQYPGRELVGGLRSLGICPGELLLQQVWGPELNMAETLPAPCLTGAMPPAVLQTSGHRDHATLHPNLQNSEPK